MPNSTRSFDPDESQPTLTHNHYSTISLSRGDTIGHYRLLQPLGGGGQGEVWLAEQSEPIRRQLAIKFLRTGNLSPSQIARFEVERQALAMMEHPAIATIFDMGIDPQVGPFFVMEFCRGEPITHYCDHHKLSIRERLALFTQVCQAVQHAHQKSIIHRDLKPSNILVVDSDRGPQVKVIDFGLAKATQSQLRLTDKSLFTEVGQLVGTYKYMSPEQASGSTLDLDTRTDIYSLGVVLYELLTGSTPVDDKSLKGKAIDEVVRMIREHDPQLPSRRLSDSIDSLASISNSRQADPKRLPLTVRGDLDWIVMKALEKDRSRRYATPNHLMEDLARHLQGEPVLAAPPSRIYRLRKLLWRRRIPAALVGLFLLSLVAGIVGTSIGYFRSQKLQRLAESRLTDATRAKESEQTQRVEAQQQREKAEQAEKLAQEKLELSDEMLDFFLYDLLLQASSIEQAERRQKPDPNLKVIDAIHRAHSLIDERFQERPLIQGRIRNLIGVVYHKLSDFDNAIDQLQKAAKLLEKELGPANKEYLDILHNIAISYGDKGDIKECVRRLEQILAIESLDPDSSFTLKVMSDLSVAFAMTDDFKRSTELTEKVLESHMRLFGPKDPQTLTTRGNLAVQYGRMFQYDRAVEHLNLVIQQEIENEGPESMSVLRTRRNLATGYRELGRLDESQQTLEEVLEIQRRILPSDHFEIALTLTRLAAVVELKKDNKRRRELLEEALQIQAKNLSPENHELLQTRTSLAMMKIDEGDFDGALKDLSAIYRTQKEILTIENPQTQMTMLNIGILYYKKKSYSQAAKALQQVVELMTKSMPENWIIDLTHIRLGRAYLAMADWPNAEKELLTGYEGLEQRRDTVPHSHQNIFSETVGNFVELYEKQGRDDEAKRWKEKL